MNKRDILRRIPKVDEVLQKEPLFVFFEDMSLKLYNFAFAILTVDEIISSSDRDCTVAADFGDMRIQARKREK